MKKSRHDVLKSYSPFLIGPIESKQGYVTKLELNEELIIIIYERFRWCNICSLGLFNFGSRIRPLKSILRK